MEGLVLVNKFSGSMIHSWLHFCDATRSMVRCINVEISSRAPNIVANACQCHIWIHLEPRTLQNTRLQSIHLVNLVNCLQSSGLVDLSMHCGSGEA